MVQRGPTFVDKLRNDNNDRVKTAREAGDLAALDTLLGVRARMEVLASALPQQDPYFTDLQTRAGGQWHIRFLLLRRLPESGEPQDLERGLLLPPSFSLSRHHAFSYIDGTNFGRFQLVFTEPRHFALPWNYVTERADDPTVKSALNRHSVLGAIVSPARVPAQLLFNLRIVPAPLTSVTMRGLEQRAQPEAILGLKKVWDASGSLFRGGQRFRVIKPAGQFLDTLYAGIPGPHTEIVGSFIHTSEQTSGTRVQSAKDPYPPAPLKAQFFPTVHEAWRAMVHTGHSYDREQVSVVNIGTMIAQAIHTLDGWRKNTPPATKTAIGSTATAIAGNAIEELGVNVVHVGKRRARDFMRGVGPRVGTLEGANPSAAMTQLVGAQNALRKRLDEAGSKRSFKTDDQHCIRHLVIEGDGVFHRLWGNLLTASPGIEMVLYDHMLFGRSTIIQAVVPPGVKTDPLNFTYRDVRPYCTFAHRLDPVIRDYDAAVGTRNVTGARQQFLNLWSLSRAAIGHILTQSVLESLADPNITTMAPVAALVDGYRAAISMPRPIPGMPLAPEHQILTAMVTDNFERMRVWLASSQATPSADRPIARVIDDFKTFVKDTLPNLEEAIRDL